MNVAVLSLGGDRLLPCLQHLASFGIKPRVHAGLRIGDPWLGCSKAFCRMLEDYRDTGVLALEDDVLLTSLDYEVPEGADFVYLGATLHSPSLPYSDKTSIVGPGGAWTTHAVHFTPKGIDALLSRYDYSVILDEWMRINRAGFAAYVCDPMIATQRPGYSDIAQAHTAYDCILDSGVTYGFRRSHIYADVDGWFTFPELYAEMVRGAVDGAKFVEVGSWKGKSSVYMAVEIANSKKDISFDCVDTWEGSEEHAGQTDGLFDLFMKNIEPVRQWIRPVRAASVDAAKGYADASLDFVFIDAAHDYDNVVADIAAWRPKVKPGGVLAGHDYTGYWPGVVRAVDDFRGENPLDWQSEGCWGMRIPS